jgi:hypothetical protein
MCARPLRLTNGVASHLTGANAIRIVIAPIIPAFTNIAVSLIIALDIADVARRGSRTADKY